MVTFSMKKATSQNKSVTSFILTVNYFKDEDECSYENGGCVHYCQNTLGNYTCSCKEGFVLARNGHNCIDKNECLENLGGCRHQCANTLGDGTWCQENLGCEHFCHTPEGRLICGCRQGYRLHPNGKNCIQTCAAGNGGCQHNCTDTPSGPICSCAPKYLLRDDNKTCIDQNECFENNGGCSHGCVNNIGSYECVCPKGYKVQINEKTCVDVNECELNTTCDHICVNTPGSFYCACRTGYQLYGVTHCADKDECSVNNGGCQYRCQNTHGGFRCHCPNGQKLHTNKKDCIDSTACQPLSTPAKSTLACSFQGGNQVCTLSCDANSYPTLDQTEYTYTCGPSTGFEWSYKQQNASLPSCSAQKISLTSIQAPSVKRTAKFIFTAVRCRTKRRIREELRRNITDQLNDCNQNPKYKRFTKGTNHAVVSAEIELEIAPLPPKRKCDIACTKKRTERRMKKTLKKMRKAVNKQEFKIRYDKQDRVIIRRTFKFKKRLDYVCPDGSVYVTGKCVACSVGTFYKQKVGQCIPCPRGTYQNQEGQMSCTKCPQNLPGVGLAGAKDINECSVMCEPGTFSRQGLKPCQSCAVGTYQPDFGRTSCLPCGGGLTTHVLGARSFQECIANVSCSAGYFYNIQSHTCNPCPKGTYQPEPGLNYCEACPGTTSTDFTATTNQTECKDVLTRHDASKYWYLHLSNENTFVIGDD
ncbi:hypothetical protein KUTeg_023763 [Tegillarca granosa]|uniref:EGF-like domain-containing protein n=1 Tax=Tegillarca granosa TaxID=220873 RepID=A0ABQ9E2P1_TEGGR|nr:hypothetical protein KUTeg_023763 [Tegillarca granosa]